VCLCPTAKAVSDAFPVAIRGACKHQERDYEGAVADYDLALKTMGGENHVDYAGEGLPFQLTRLAKRTRAQTCHLYTYNIFVYMCVFVCVCVCVWNVVWSGRRWQASGRSTLTAWPDVGCLLCRVDLMYNKALSLKKLGRIDAAASIVAEAVAALDDKTATRKVMGLNRTRDQMCAAKPPSTA